MVWRMSASRTLPWVGPAGSLEEHRLVWPVALGIWLLLGLVGTGLLWPAIRRSARADRGGRLLLVARPVALACWGLSDFVIRSFVPEWMAGAWISPAVLLTLAIAAAWGFAGADLRRAGRWAAEPAEGGGSVVARRDALRHLLGVEAAGIAALFASLWFVSLSPQIMATQEKLSDLASLTAVERAQTYPASDHWMAGEPHNYHYAGYIPYARISELFGAALSVPVEQAAGPPGMLVSPRSLSHTLQAYVLGLAMVGAMVLLSAAALAWSLTGRRRAALAAGIVVGLGGNLSGAWLAEGPSLMRTAAWLGGGSAGDWRNVPWFGDRATLAMDGSSGGQLRSWATTRCIAGQTDGEGPITEYPVFSLLIGDLHAHWMNLPISLAALALACGGRGRWRSLWPVVAVAGFSALSHPIEAPMLLVGVGLALLFGPRRAVGPEGPVEGAASRRSDGLPRSAGQESARRRSWLARLAMVVVVGAVAAGLLGIFARTYSSPVGGIFVEGQLARVALIGLQALGSGGAGKALAVLEGRVQNPLAVREELEAGGWTGSVFWVLANGYRPIQFRRYPQTAVGDFIEAAGVGVLLLAAGLWLTYARSARASPMGSSLLLWLTVLLVGLAVALRSGGTGFVAIVLGVLGVCSLRTAWRERTDGAVRCVCMLSAACLFWLGLPEVLCLQERYAEIRLNTVFKLYYHAGPVLTVCGLALLLHRPRPGVAELAGPLPPNAGPSILSEFHRRLACRADLAVGVVAFWVVLLCSVSTAAVLHDGLARRRADAVHMLRIGALAGSPAWWSWPRLDGSRWARLHWPYAGDLEAAAYLASRSPGPGELLAEAWGEARGDGEIAESFSLAGRLSVLSGWPSLLAWPGHHELRWPTQLDASVSEQRDRPYYRRRDVLAELYIRPTSELSREAIVRYGLRYVAVGAMERGCYGEGIVEAWEASGYQRVWPAGLAAEPHAGGTLIYDVRQGGGGAAP